MKPLTSFLILLLISGQSFCQQEKIKLTAKEFFEESELIDTITRTIISKSGITLKRELICRMYNQNFGDTLLLYLIKDEFYSDGTPKSHIIYNRDTITDTGYNNKRIISFKYVHELSDYNSRIMIIKPNGVAVDRSRRIIGYIYKKGILVKQDSRLVDDSGLIHRKEGLWKYYDKDTGKLIREETYKRGKKVLSKKI